MGGKPYNQEDSEQVVAYPAQAAELTELLAHDQAEHKAVARLYWEDKQRDAYTAESTRLDRQFQQRAKRALEILTEIGEPSLRNLGTEAAQALSVLASHSPRHQDLRHVLEAFQACYERDKNDTFYQAIPAMTDILLLSERKPQRFGTIWLFDDKGWPWLPTVDDFERVDERRAAYDIGPLRWPKSLAIPESRQPWLQLPLPALTMRSPTDAEWAELGKQ